MSDIIELFSARVCPYAHRARLALAVKGIDFELTEIDLSNKPQRFLDVSPYGKVPALTHAGVTIYESNIINQYLDDVYPGPSMMPSDPLVKARVRIWLDYMDNKFLDIYYDAIGNQDRAKDDEFRTKIEDGFRFMENDGMAVLSGDGPYWLGAEISLLDLAYYPFFERLPAWTHYRGIDIPDDCPRLQKWRTAMAEHPAVTEIANSPEYYIEGYKKYAA
jgi:glutathione S-transferase